MSLQELTYEKDLLNLSKEMLLQRVKPFMSLSIYEIINLSMTNGTSYLSMGKALAFMDKAAFMVASRYTNRRIATISSKYTEIASQIKTDHLLEAIASIKEVGHTSLTVSVN